MKDYAEISNYTSMSCGEKGRVLTAYLRDPHSRSITRMLYNVIAANRTSVEFV
jgi:hypothetical protein